MQLSQIMYTTTWWGQTLIRNWNVDYIHHQLNLNLLTLSFCRLIQPYVCVSRYCQEILIIYNTQGLLNQERLTKILPSMSNTSMIYVVCTNSSYIDVEIGHGWMITSLFIKWNTCGKCTLITEPDFRICVYGYNTHMSHIAIKWHPGELKRIVPEF